MFKRPSMTDTVLRTQTFTRHGVQGLFCSKLTTNVAEQPAQIQCMYKTLAWKTEACEYPFPRLRIYPVRPIVDIPAPGCGRQCALDRVALISKPCVQQVQLSPYRPGILKRPVVSRKWALAMTRATVATALANFLSE